MSDSHEQLTMRQLAFTPRWIAMLVLALVVAAVFAWLGKWQVERAIIQGAKDTYNTEIAVALDTIAQPSSPLANDVAGRRVTIDATLDPASFVVVGNRVNEGAIGCWVTGRLVGESGALAVALGWAPTLEQCEATADEMSGEPVIQALVEWQGRYSPPEGPEAPGPSIDPSQLNYMSVAALYNVWPDSTSPVYAGYLIAEQDVPGLSRISSTPPITDASLNLLNVFYAVEWVVFAGGAVFLWWRLLRDDWERRTEAD